MRVRIDTLAPIDLAAMCILAGIALVLELLDIGPWLQVPFGLLFVLVAPGYALLAWLFPRRLTSREEGGRGLSPLAWIAISMGLSLAIVTLAGLAIDRTPVGLRPAVVLGTLGIFTVVASAGAMVRRANLPSDAAFRLRFEGAILEGRGTPQRRAVAILLTLSFLLIAGAVAYTALAPKPDERFTEFYLLGNDGRANCYPANFDNGSFGRERGCAGLGNVTVGITNHERRTTHYWMRAVWTREVPDESTAASILEVEEWTAFDVELASVPVDLTLTTNFTPQHEVRLQVPPPPSNATWRLSFQLYLEPPPAPSLSSGFLESPYRRAYLWIQA